MRALADNRVRGLLLLAAALAVIAALTYPAAAPSAPQTIDLCAKEGVTTLPGGVTVPIWGFASKPAGLPCSDSSVVATLPGPQLNVTEGDTVTLNVTNVLSGRTISIDAPGIDFDAGPTDAAPGATVTRTFPASAAGTYLYESSGSAGRQTAMGLYGALVVHAPTGPAVEQTLVLSEIDPELNRSADPDAYSMLDWEPTFWLINGKAFPDTATIDVPAAAPRQVRLRYVNAGLEHVTMTMLGIDTRMVARNGFPLADPVDVVSQTFAAGATAEGIVTLPTSAAVGATFPLYDRQLHLANGATGTSDHTPGTGGMLTFIRVVP